MTGGSSAVHALVTSNVSTPAATVVTSVVTSSVPVTSRASAVGSTAMSLLRKPKETSVVSHQSGQTDGAKQSVVNIPRSEAGITSLSAVGTTEKPETDRIIESSTNAERHVSQIFTIVYNLTHSAYIDPVVITF